MKIIIGVRILFFLDKDNKVLAIGNPIHNPKVKELYLKSFEVSKWSEKISLFSLKNPKVTGLIPCSYSLIFYICDITILCCVYGYNSLVGVSLSSTYVTYTPTYNSTTPTNSIWNIGATDFTSIAYFTDDVTDGSQTNTFLNDAARNIDANYAVYKGDICKYLSMTGAVSGNWRMPTAQEYNAEGLADNATVAWTTATAPWAKFGDFAAITSNAQGTTQISSSGGTYTINGSINRFPASSNCNTSGTLGYVG
ncbi:hypothetical protein [uncultured Bacteroides sp.]|uniref:hypothetical protein n=1 Tax=uncultured Bacteroides sp. TaxID=162156 RepID=UPI002AAAAB18|nr:hypothetical protein [uncultured Bacteroides sp.]